MYRLVRYGNYYLLLYLADTTNSGIQKKHLLIPISDTPSIYKDLKHTRYSGKKHSLQHVLYSKSKKSIAYTKKNKLDKKKKQASTTL